MSDPHAKRWLADDPNFLHSLGDLDRGLLEANEPFEEEPVDARPSAAAQPDPEPPIPAALVTPPPASPAQGVPPAAAIPASPRAPQPINVARALDPARVLDAAPPATPPPSVRPPPTALPAPVRLVPADPDAFADEPLPPPLAFNRRATPEPGSRRALAELFPPSAFEAERHVERAPAAGPPRPLNYETFYGLHEQPFSLSTDPRFHYQSGAHERAAQEILAAIRKRGGPAVLTAPLGMGKTTLCRSLVLEIDRRTVTSLVLEPVRTIDDLLKTMLVDFGVIAADELSSAPHVAREALTGTLLSFLESLAGLQAGAVLFIDEAQNLPATLLGDLAVLIGSPAARVLQIVFVGQPALTGVLMHDDLRAFNASVSRRTELGPLAADEVSSYVMHRLSIAGANTRLEFDEAAIERLYELSGGVPRVVNLLCDRALTRGHAASAGVIDLALVDASAEDLDLERPENESLGLLASLLIVLMFALLVIAGAAAALWVSRDAVARTIQQWENVPLPPGGPIRRLPLPLAPIRPPADM